MSYVVLARKWRPAMFEDVIAQSHVTVTLQNAVRGGRAAHAYLFAGPRGCGKTTTARILAKALNCEKGPTPEPCNGCRACVSVNRGTSPDVLEIDAASNRGIDEIRSLREKVIIGISKPTGRKVYIIDEVHMLTPEAFNALLKTLEEPPSHVMFVLATTEPHRVPQTILSRCQRFNFRRIPSEQIAGQLALIARQEGIQIPEEAVFLIARRADGAMRDAQSLLDQVVSYTGTSVTQEAVREALGILDQDLFFRTTEAIAARDRMAGLNLANEMIEGGGDIGEFVRGLLEHLRNLLICKVQGGPASLDLPDPDRARYQACSVGFAADDLLRMIQIVSDLERDIGKVIQPRLHLELGLLKLISLESSVSIEHLFERLDRIEGRLTGESGASVPLARAQDAAGALGVPGPEPPSVPNARRPPAPASPDGEAVRGREAPSIPPPVPPPSFSGRAHPKLNEAAEAARDRIRAPGEEREATSPPPPVQPAGPASLDLVRRKWGEILSRAKAASISVGTHLEAGTPCGLVDETLQVGFPSRSKFSADHIKRKKKALEDVIEEVVGARLRVECLLVEWQGDSPDAREKGTDLTSGVQNVLQTFDGEVLNG